MANKIDTANTMVFCDFDGTITINETLRAMFVDLLPTQAPSILSQLEQGNITLRQTLIELTNLLPANSPQRMCEIIAAEPLRPGFSEFVTFLQQHGIPLVILSSGFDFYILSKLQPWLSQIYRVHALQTIIDDEYLQLQLDYDDPIEAIPKAEVMHHYRAHFNIAIGDSMSDFQIAQQADLVFARDKLLHQMQGQANVCPFDDFFDIRQQLQDRLD